MLGVQFARIRVTAFAYARLANGKDSGERSIQQAEPFFGVEGADRRNGNVLYAIRATSSSVTAWPEMLR